MKGGAVCAAFLLLLLPGLGGCADSGDMKDIELVSAMAVDGDERGITAAVQLLQRNKALEPQYAESYYMLAASERDLAGALGELYKKGARQLNFSHTTVMLLGNDAAGLADWLDYALRSSELRPTVYPVVADGSAAELLAAEESDQAPIYLLGSILEPKVIGDPGYAAVTLQEFITAVQQPGQAPVLPCVAGTEDGVKLTGFVVYDAERPTGELMGDAALGWLLVGRTAYLRGLSLGVRQDVVLTVKKADVFAVVKQDVGGTGVEVCFRLRCVLDVAENPQGIQKDAVLQLAKERLRQVFAAALAGSRRSGLDFLGIGREIYRKLPDEWALLRQTDYLNRVDCRLDVIAELSPGG